MISVGNNFKAKTFDEIMDERHSNEGGQKYIAKGVYKKANILLVLNRKNAGRRGQDKKKSFYAKIENWGGNIVTNNGDIYYATKAVGGTPTDNYGGSNGRMELADGVQTIAKTDQYGQVNSPIVASRQAIDATYPDVNDTDADNTGAGVNIVTWRVSWTKSSFTDNTIQGGCIHDGAGSPTATTNLLTHFSVTSFAKTINDTLKGFVNHEMLGV